MYRVWGLKLPKSIWLMISLECLILLACMLLANDGSILNRELLQAGSAAGLGNQTTISVLVIGLVLLSIPRR